MNSEPQSAGRTLVSQRYPDLVDIDNQDNDRKLEIYRNVLDSLHSELDESRD